MKFIVETDTSYESVCNANNQSGTIFSYTKYDNLGRFRTFRKKYIEGLRLIFEKNLSHVKLFNFLQKLESAENTIIETTGPGILVFFHWPNGELKYLCLRNEITIIPNKYWLHYYPFLKCINQKKSEWLLNYDVMNRFESIDNFKYISPSHNNHFGHFIYDDFPLIATNLGSSMDMRCLINYNWSQGIISLCNLFLASSNYEKLKIAKGSMKLNSKFNYIFKTQNARNMICTNIILNSFLLELSISKIMQSKSKTNKINKSLRRVIITRQGKYGSRIKNRGELTKKLESDFDFIEVNPNDYSEERLLELIYNADIIVAESGSCTVTASSYSSPFTKIVSLIPERLLRNPSDAMVESGIPYHCIFPQKTSFFLGKSEILNQIQSSDIASYDYSKLKIQIESLI